MCHDPGQNTLSHTLTKPRVTRPNAGKIASQRAPKENGTNHFMPSSPPHITVSGLGVDQWEQGTRRSQRSRVCEQLVPYGISRLNQGGTIIFRAFYNGHRLFLHVLILCSPSNRIFVNFPAFDLLYYTRTFQLPNNLEKMLENHEISA